MKGFAAYLDVPYTTLRTYMLGERDTMRFSTARQIANRLGDNSIYVVLGLPDLFAVIDELKPEERDLVVAWLDMVISQVVKAPPSERMSRLNKMLSPLSKADTNTF